MRAKHQFFARDQFLEKVSRSCCRDDFSPVHSIVAFSSARADAF
jgi:hypothetical protein